jgi:hypothetical protein
MLRLGAKAIWVLINLNLALPDCNIVVPTVQELSDCTTTQKVEEIQAPDKNIGIGHKGSAIFIPAPALRNAILMSNTREPFKLILLMMTATARAFDAAHLNNGNMQGTAITHSDNQNAWLHGMKRGLIP